MFRDPGVSAGLEVADKDTLLPRQRRPATVHEGHRGVRQGQRPANYGGIERDCSVRSPNDRGG